MTKFGFKTIVVGTQKTDNKEEEVELTEIGTIIDEYDITTAEKAEEAALEEIREIELKKYFEKRFEVKDVRTKIKLEKIEKS